MEDELIHILDRQGHLKGVATRREIHQAGHWHNTFHCWFIDQENGRDYIIFQIRSDQKKDFPGMLDITAAGHILANETVEEGVRELHEELGLDISFEDLTGIGLIQDRISQGEFIDNELCSVFLYDSNVAFDRYNLQIEEVSGIVRAELLLFEKLWAGDIDHIAVHGFQINELGNQTVLVRQIRKQDIVPHDDRYMDQVIRAIKHR
ncbi:NUDIX hydrolase [Peribacillus sp. SCS-155]|uniref:NUDIX hydrolase n=1 Tax=Peribacillus sedimenti TaxID=3115297 RepID=UPI0039061F33